MREISSDNLESSEVGSIQEVQEIPDFEPVEFKDEYKSSKEIADSVHLETKRDMLSEHGDVMSESQKEMLESNETLDRLNVVSSEEYVARFEDVPLNVIGHCDSEGNIYIKDISTPTVEHVSTHETMHLCADRRIETEANGDEVIVSGIRETRFHEDGRVTDMNCGINEGLTEMYTLRELENTGREEAIQETISYPETRMWAERLESLAGKENVEAAYFGDSKEGLINEFNRLNGYDGAWNQFSRDIDILARSGNTKETQHAKERLFVQYKTMAINRYEGFR